MSRDNYDKLQGVLWWGSGVAIFLFIALSMVEWHAIVYVPCGYVLVLTTMLGGVDYDAAMKNNRYRYALALSAVVVAVFAFAFLTGTYSRWLLGPTAIAYVIGAFYFHFAS